MDSQNIITSIEKSFSDSENVNAPMTHIAENASFYRPGAIRGDAFSQMQLASCYRSGLGVKRNLVEAYKWYRKAAEQGLTDAQYYLAIACYNGEGTKKDYKEAFNWFAKAASGGHIDAMYRLTIFYSAGMGTDEDKAEALRIIISLATEYNYAIAQFNLAICYYRGFYGLMADGNTALYWLERALSCEGALPEIALVYADKFMELLKSEGYSSTWVNFTT
ncbi:MAG: sel1 repeat family protein [Tannerellaceae bacterium]|jgi:TPR repeat protein|nr:sel1 repeat family protein [Tannerellaceae bacterium]